MGPRRTVVVGLFGVATVEVFVSAGRVANSRARRSRVSAMACAEAGRPSGFLASRSMISFDNADGRPGSSSAGDLGFSVATAISVLMTSVP